MTLRQSTVPSFSLLSSGGLWLLLACFCAALCFRSGIEALLLAWQMPEYSHGPLIPAISAFLFARQYGELPAGMRHVPQGSALPGLALTALALGAGALGALSGIDELVSYALILWCGGILLTAFGWTLGQRFWPAILHLVFMLPLPGLLHFAVTTSLQGFSSSLGVAFVQVMGIPVLLEGNIIDLGSYRLHVAEACSGLRYLFPILSFSYVVAILYQGPVWHRAAILLAAAPVAVLLNALRISIVALLVDLQGPEAAMGLSHLLEGWVVFLACLAVLLGLASTLARLQKPGRRLEDALDLDMAAVGPALQSLRGATASAAFMGAVLLTLAAGMLSPAAYERGSSVILRDPLGLFPETLGAWSIEDWMRLSPAEATALGADDYISAIYEDRDGHGSDGDIELLIAYYEDQSQGGIHSPRICLPGGGWEVDEISVTEIALDGLEIPLTRAVIQKGTTRRLVYYWFEQHGGRSAIDWQAKLALVRGGILHGRTDGALVRLVTPVRPGEGIEQADMRLQDMLAPLMAELNRFVPSAETEEALPEIREIAGS